MTLTIHEIKDRIAYSYDVIGLCELLEITEEDILDNFEDRVMTKLDKIYEELYNEDYDQDES